MKRFNKTAVAVALTGALTLGVSPVAGAATPATLQPGDLVFDANGNIVSSFSGTTDGLVNLENGDVVYNSDSENVTADRTANTPETLENTDPIPVTLQPGDLIFDANGNLVSSFGMTDNGQAVLRYGDTVLNKDSENVTAIRTGNDATNESDAQPVTLSWGDLVVDKDGNVVLFAKANGEYAVLQPGDQVIPAGKIGAGVLGGLGVIALGGILYNVVKNAQGENVLVPADRPNQAPTAEDEKKTQELVANHQQEIAEQAAKQNADNGALRGVGANTGSNAIGQGLIALVLASILAAAAFVFGRRQLV